MMDAKKTEHFVITYQWSLLSGTEWWVQPRFYENGNKTYNGEWPEHTRYDAPQVPVSQDELKQFEGLDDDRLDLALYDHIKRFVSSRLDLYQTPDERVEEDE
jgi:hypothetical protein